MSHDTFCFDLPIKSSSVLVAADTSAAVIASPFLEAIVCSQRLSIAILMQMFCRGCALIALDQSTTDKRHR